MGKSIKSFAKSIHSKIGNLLEGEKITPRGGSSLINHTKDSIYKGLTPTKLATVLNNLREGNPRDFLILAEEFEEKDPSFYLSNTNTQASFNNSRANFVNWRY